MQSKNGLPPRNEWFDAFARKTASICGKPIVFLLALAIVIVWGLTVAVGQCHRSIFALLLSHPNGRDLQRLQYRTRDWLPAMKDLVQL
jgi:low affinity Fe/Cu permease